MRQNTHARVTAVRRLTLCCVNIISEYMANIGIATTRALAVVDTGEQLTRQTRTASGILTRIASSHIRVGTFEYAARQSTDELKALADFAIERHYPYLAALTEEKNICYFMTMS